MISFETRYNEATGKWQWRHPGKHWSEEMPLGKVADYLRLQVADTPAPVNSSRFKEQWGKPLAHAPKRQGPTSDTPLYEIKGKKVQRIASSAAERQSQQLNELADLLGLDP